MFISNNAGGLEIKPETRLQRSASTRTGPACARLLPTINRLPRSHRYTRLWQEADRQISAVNLHKVPKAEDHLEQLAATKLSFKIQRGFMRVCGLLD